MLQVILTIVYVIVCLFLIGVVLLQTGKRADLAGAFGGGGSQTAFGARGAATLLTRATTGFAVAFMLLALTLSILASVGRGRTSVLEQVADPAAQTEPAGDDSTGAAPAAGDLPSLPADVPTDDPAQP